MGTMSPTEEIKANDMMAWLREWPWLLILDGFDEVVALEARERVIRAGSDLLVDAHG